MDFRIAHDEHRHVWCLWTDLDQAVLPQSSSGLAALITDVLEEIVFQLDSLDDLCSLGATCQRLRDIVHPWHTEYRIIRCRPSAVHVWRHLAEHPFLARNVRHLHITSEGSPEMDREIFPRRANGRPVHYESFIRTHDSQIGQRERDLIDLISCALSHTMALATFSWTCNDATICFDDISPKLLMCPSLREMEVTDGLMFSPLPDGATSRSDNFVLPDLTCVKIRGGPLYQGVYHPSLDRIQRLLISHCPNLATLHIAYEGEFFANEFLLHGRWPSLRTFSLVRGFSCSACKSFDAVAGFLVAHPLIETLELEINRMQLQLPVGTLARLRHLACKLNIAVAILGCPMTEGQTRPLEELRLPWIGRRYGRGVIEGLRLHPGLKRLEFEGYNNINRISSFAEAAPNITWLDVGRGPEWYGPKVSSVDDWADVLGALPELTTLNGVRFFYEADTDVASHSGRDQIKKNDEVVSMLVQICPKLKQVGRWDDSGRVVILSKEGGKACWVLQGEKSATGDEV